MHASGFDLTAIVTAYQSEATIERALWSISRQVVPAKAVIVVDDGSTDGTASRAMAVNGVQVRQLDHLGVVARSRNVAVEHATTEYVAFLDADDQWTPKHLAWAQEVLADNITGLTCGNALRFMADSAEVEPFFAHLEPTSPYGGRGALHPIPLRDLLLIRPIVASSVVVRRSLLASAGGFSEDPEMAGSEDFEAWCRLLLHCQALYDQRVHLIYNQGLESLTRGSREKNGRQATITVLQSFLADPSFQDVRRDIRSAIARDQVAWARRCVRRRAYGDALRHLFLGGNAIVGR